MGNAEYQRAYRKTHPNYDRHHKARQDRYLARLKAGLVNHTKQTITVEGKKYINNKPAKIPSIEVKRIVLKHYGGGKCACVKCGESDIDCLSIDHVNNDAHHRQNNKRLGGTQLYRKLMAQGFPKGYQTLCYNHNMKKAIELCRNNGGNKKGTPQQKTSLPLFEYLDNMGTSGDVKGQSMDVRGTTGTAWGTTAIF